MVATKKALLVGAASAIGVGTVGATAQPASAHSVVLTRVRASAEVGPSHQGITVCNLDPTIATGWAQDTHGRVETIRASQGCNAWKTDGQITRFALCVEFSGCTAWRTVT